MGGISNSTSLARFSIALSAKTSPATLKPVTKALSIHHLMTASLRMTLKTMPSKNYPYNELYVNKPNGNGYYRVDSYNPATGEIVSRKFTQFSDITESTATNYIREAVNKYPAGATIAKVPSSGSLAGDALRGSNILEVPPQVKPIPQSVLNAADKAGVVIRDTNGKVYQ